MKPSQKMLSDALLKDLQESRISGRSSPENPVTSNIICAIYKKRHGWDITDVDIRDAVAYSREIKLPIGSTLQGYYYVTKSIEWEATKAMLLPKFLSIKKRLDDIQFMQEAMSAEENGQMQMLGEVGEYLKHKLELEKV